MFVKKRKILFRNRILARNILLNLKISGRVAFYEIVPLTRINGAYMSETME